METTVSRLTIEHAASGRRIVDAGPDQFAEVEGNWYVDPSAVDLEQLELTERDYTCPYKGTCLYVDHVDGKNRTTRVAWVYHDPKPGWEHIKGKYGFYSGEAAAKFGKTKDTLS